MADFCLPPAMVTKFLDALRTGKLDPTDLMSISSEERRTRMAEFVGADNARDVNALFESKMLLADQKRGLVTWAKQVAGLSDKTKLDFIDKINKLDRVLEPADERAFLADLAAQKLGATVTAKEATSIAQGAQRVAKLREQWTGNTWSSDQARLDYGNAYVQYQEYVGELLRDANTRSFKEWISGPKKQVFLDIANSTKGIVASLDNSFFGRQGIKMLYSNPDIWARDFLKSWGDIASSLGGGDPLAVIKADIYSRPNAMNGNYGRMKLALGMEVEEAFPTTLPERIPIFGRIYKASEAAFNGGALRFRADYGDRVIKMATDFGVDTRNAKQMEGVGRLVNAMTGRGAIGHLGSAAETINAAFFSIRFVKSNYDTLFGHVIGSGIEAGPARDFVRRQAAMNLLKIAGGMAAVLFTANQFWPGSVEMDPRSSDFGKIKIGNTRFDISGGMGAMVTLAARLVPTLHNGKWGMWSKSSTSGTWTNLQAGAFGQRTGLDVINDFFEGKLSPLAGTIRDLLKGKNFNGAPLSYQHPLDTALTIGPGLVVPMGYSSLTDAMNTPNSANLLAIAILDGLGFGANTYSNAPPPAHPRQLWDVKL